jgi:potassium channel LctB
MDDKGINGLIKKAAVGSWYDKITFRRIFLMWVVIVVAFGIIYFYLNGPDTYLKYNIYDEPVNKLSDAIYFSFVAATTTGFGDIVPIGYFKLISIFEVVLGLLLLAMVTSKLISIKQNVILSEIYELSFHEKINRLRSTMLLFRQNLSRLIVKIEEHRIRKRELSDLYIYISSLEDALQEVKALNKGGSKEFLIKIDAVNAELLYSSIVSSFEKLFEILAMLENLEIEWRREITLGLIHKALKLNEELFSKLSTLNLIDKIVNDLKKRNSEAVVHISAILNQEKKEK